MGMQTQPSLETGRRQPEEGSESKGGGCDEKGEAVPEEVTPKKKPTYIKGTLGDISQHWKHER